MHSYCAPVVTHRGSVASRTLGSISSVTLEPAIAGRNEKLDTGMGSAESPNDRD